MRAEQTEAVDDSVGYFLQDMEYHGRSERTRDAYERVLRRYEAFLDEEHDADPESAGHRECLAWIHSLRGDELSDSTIATYASYLHRFYAYMNQVGAFDANPMALVMDELDERIERNPARRDVSLDEMRAFVADVTHPLERAVICTLLKTGMRVGELCNLDLRDVVLPHTGETRPQLARRDPSLYVTAEPAAGEEFNGEVRTASNKRKRATLIPIDDELRRILTCWLAIRPDPRSAADPLFVSTSDGWGERLDPDAVSYIVRKHAADAGWHRQGGGAEENVTPHYFRHFFTTHLRDRTGDRGIVKYLRGDVAEDVIDTYTHNWGDRVREVYLEHVYSLSCRHESNQ